MIRYPQENTNTEALTRYRWKHGDLQLNKTAHPHRRLQETPKYKTADTLKNHYK